MVFLLRSTFGEASDIFNKISDDVNSFFLFSQKVFIQNICLSSRTIGQLFVTALQATSVKVYLGHVSFCGMISTWRPKSATSLSARALVPELPLLGCGQDSVRVGFNIKSPIWLLFYMSRLVHILIIDVEQLHVLDL